MVALNESGRLFHAWGAATANDEYVCSTGTVLNSAELSPARVWALCGYRQRNKFDQAGCILSVQTVMRHHTQLVEL